MEPVVYILAIMGCQQGYAQCEPLAVAPTRYESAAACDAGSEAVAHRPVALEFDAPVVAAQCLAMDPAAAALLLNGDVERLEPAPKARPGRRSMPWATRRARG